MHNSINTKEFIYDEVKKLSEPEKKYSLRRILFKFSYQILQNYLYRVKSLLGRNSVSFYENYHIRNSSQKGMGITPFNAVTANGIGEALLFS